MSEIVNAIPEGHPDTAFKNQIIHLITDMWYNVKGREETIELIEQMVKCELMINELEIKEKMSENVS